MRDFTEHSITDAVIAAFDKTPNARLKTLIGGLVRHLHDYAREVRLTQDEWTFAIDFLTRTGQTCTDVRQEFILLSDTLGLSMLVDAINHPDVDGATETTVLGPFYVEKPPELPLGADVSWGLPGEPLFVEGTVRGIDGPLRNAIVDIWHSDQDGYYDVQRADLQGAHLRARFRTDADGRFWFRSIVPSFYPIPDDGPVGDMLAATGRHPFRPAHVHFMIAAPGYQTLVTHVFSADDQYLDSDAVFGVKNSLIRDFTRRDPGPAPDGGRMDRPWRKLSYDFSLNPTAKT